MRRTAAHLTLRPAAAAGDADLELCADCPPRASIRAGRRGRRRTSRCCAPAVTWAMARNRGACLLPSPLNALRRARLRARVGSSKLRTDRASVPAPAPSRPHHLLLQRSVYVSAPPAPPPLVVGRSRGVRRAVRHRARGADAVRAVLREEPDPLRQLPVAHLHDGSLRDLLLP